MNACVALIAIGERYESYLPKAAARWGDLTGLPVVAFGDGQARQLGCPHDHPGERACWLKLHLWDLVPDGYDVILYADMDIWPIKPAMPSEALDCGVGLAVVRDRWADPVVAAAAESIGLAHWDYFNAGLLYMRRDPMAAVMRDARKSFCQLPWWDQTALNLTTANAGVSVRYLPWTHNAMDSSLIEHGLRGVHGSGTAWRLWETLPHDGILHPPLHHRLEDFLARNFDWWHGYVTDRTHVLELAQTAGSLGGRAQVIEVGTFQGHSAFAMAHAGAGVTTLDPANKTGRWFVDGVCVDALACTGLDFLAFDLNQWDMVFHDAEHGPSIIPELQEWWSRIRPGGILAIHDSEQLHGHWRADRLPGYAGHTETADARGRMLAIVRKSI